MCNQHKLKTSTSEIEALFRDVGFALGYPEGVPNVEPRDCVRITDVAPIVRAGGAGGEVVQRPWSWRGPGGAPVFNLRSEGRRFPAASRCAIPTDGFYEFTASADRKARRKDRWLFTMAGRGPFFIAGCVRDGAWAMLTTAPGPDVAPFHERQVVAFTPAEAIDWLQGGPEAELLRPSPAGVLLAAPCPAEMTTSRFDLALFSDEPS